MLAVLSDKRLDGSLANVPTMKELGFDVQWPIIRGFFMGPKVSDADFKVWSDTFTKMMATPEYEKLRTERGLFKFALTGKELDAFIKDRMVAYRQLAGEFKLKVAN